MSFGVSGIYLSFLLTVIGSMIARGRGWVPEGSFQLGRWGWAVSILGAVYLGLMLVNVVVPTGLSSPRGGLQPRLDHAARDVRHRWSSAPSTSSLPDPTRSVAGTSTTSSSRPAPNGAANEPRQAARR